MMQIILSLTTFEYLISILPKPDDAAVQINHFHPYFLT